MNHRSKIAFALCAVSLSSMLMTGMGYGVPVKEVYAQSPILLETPISEWHPIYTEVAKASAALKKQAHERAKEEE